MRNRSRTSAFSLVELLVLLLVISIFAALFIPGCFDLRSAAKAKRIKCINNLKNIGLAVRFYATDNNDLLPGAYFLSNKTDLVTIDADTAAYFRMISNELSTPRIIACPADKRVKETI